MGSRRPPLLAAVSLLTVCLLGSAASALALSPHVRDSWVVGVAVGTGQGKVALFAGEEANRVESGWQRGVVPQYRIGYALVDDRLVVSVENKQWLYEQGLLAEDKLRVNVQNWALGFTFYPANPTRLAGGLYVQAGVGLANARLTLLEPLVDDPYGNKFEEIFMEDEGGTAYTVSLGYEFRVVHGLAAGLSLSYVYQDIGGDIFDDASSLPAALTLNYYW